MRDDSKKVLVDAFRHVVRYAMRKTKRSVEEFGVTEEYFTREALDESLSSSMNAQLFRAREQQRSLRALVSMAQLGSVTFQFFWRVPGAAEPHVAAFEMFFLERTNLKVRLLWLGLPDTFPVSPSVGVIDGKRPLKEAVFEVVRVREDGGLEAFPHPQQ